MARPPKGMDEAERQALEAFLAGTADPETERQAMGVLRALWPEYAEQLADSPSKRANLLRLAQINTRYALLTDPRMRDENMRRPYLPQEAIAKIAVEAGLSHKYMEDILRPTRQLEADVADANLQVRAQAYQADLQRHWSTLRAAYKTEFAIGVPAWAHGNPAGLEAAMPEAHKAAVSTVAATFGASEEDVVLGVAELHQTLVEEYRQRCNAIALQRRLDSM